MNPSFLYDSVFEHLVLQHDSEAAGFPMENILDWRRDVPFRWKAGSTSSPQRCWITPLSPRLPGDTAVIAGHNLGTISAKWKIMYTDAAHPTWTDASAWVTPSDDTPSAVTFTKQTADGWMIRIEPVVGSSFSVAPQLGIVTVGERLELDQGIMPGFDPYGETPVRDFVRNENGAPLGSNLRYIDKEFALEYEDSPMNTSGPFFTRFYPELLPHLRTKPVWFGWNLSEDITAIYLCWAEGKITTPFASLTTLRDLRIVLKGTMEIAL